jgi:hypothetical protein
MAMTQRSMIDRMRGAALLEIETYEEVETDTSATGQAAAVVAMVALAQGIGASGQGGRGILAGLLISMVGWLIWAGVTYLIGETVFGGTATWGELLRTLGFAQTPGLLAILGFIPGLGGLIRFAAAIWVLVAGIIAIRQALDFSTGKAVLTAVLGWVVIVIPMALLAMGTGGMMAR